MITQEQLDELKEEERYHLAMAESCCESNERGRISHTKTADALAAAIATIERLPVTADGVRVAIGDKVYVTHRGEAHVAHIVPDADAEDDCGCFAEAWVKIDGKTTSIRSCNVSESYSTALAAKGGGDA